MYTLGGVSVLQLSYLEELYTTRADFAKLGRVSPKVLLAQEAGKIRYSGGLGATLVVPIELPKGVNRPPGSALKEVRRSLLQGLLVSSRIRRWRFILCNL